MMTRNRKRASLLLSAAALSLIGGGLLWPATAEEQSADRAAAATTSPALTGPAAGQIPPASQPAKPPAAADAGPDGNDDAVTASPGTQPSAGSPATGPAMTGPPATSPASPTTSPAAQGTFGQPPRPGSSRYSRDNRSGGSSSDRDRQSASAAAAAPASKKLDQKYEILLKRSLFSKTRPEESKISHPTALPGTRPAAAPPPPETLMAVRGMSIEGEDGDGECYAFIEDLPQRRMLRLTVGDKVARGTIAEVTLADLVYEYEGKRTRVSIGHTLDGAPAPAISWTTYTPVAATPPPRTDGRSDSGRSDSGRSGDSSRSTQSSSDASRGGPTPSPATPAVAPAAVTPSPGAPPAAGGETAEERMRRIRREQ